MSNKLYEDIVATVEEGGEKLPGFMEWDLKKCCKKLENMKDPYGDIEEDEKEAVLKEAANMRKRLNKSCGQDVEKILEDYLKTIK